MSSSEQRPRYAPNCTEPQNAVSAAPQTMQMLAMRTDLAHGNQQSQLFSLYLPSHAAAAPFGNPPSQAPFNFSGLGTLGLPKFSSKSKIIFSAFLLLKYGNGPLASPKPTLGSTCPATPADAAFAASEPGIGKRDCNTSYAASVKPNWGDERKIRAGPPFQNALNPSSRQILRAQSSSPLYVAWPLRASTCSRVLITSHGVVR